MTDHEKAVEVLDTPPTATETNHPAILGLDPFNRNDFQEIRDRFAARRYWLERSFRADDGRITFHVSRWTQTRAFVHGHDLIAFLAVVEGLPL